MHPQQRGPGSETFLRMKAHDPERSPPRLFKRISPINRTIGLLGLFTVLAALLFVDSDFVIGATGRVELARGVPVFAARGGIVEELRFREGDAVEAGQVVVELREPARAAALLAVEQRLAAAQNALNRAELDLQEWEIRPGEASILVAPERLRWLDELLDARRSIVGLLERALEDDLVSPLEVSQEQLGLLEATGARIEVGLQKEWLDGGLPQISRERLEALADYARQHRTLLEKELRWLEQEQMRGDVATPMAGRIAALEYEYPGMAVPAGGFVFEVLDESGPFEVEALVGERNFDLLRVGGPVRMKSNVAGSLLGGDVRGVIAQLPLKPEEEGTDGPLYAVEIEVTDSSFPLVHGSTVQVEFVLGRRTLLDALLDGLAGRNARGRMNTATAGTPTDPTPPSDPTHPAEAPDPAKKNTP